jgi:hypothetical protein
MIEQAPHRIGPTPYRRFLKIAMDTLVILLVVLNWIATQTIAAALHYPPFFMGRIAGHVYQPLAWWWWQYHWPRNAVRIGHQVIPLERAWAFGNHLVFYPVIALVVVGGMLSGLFLKWGGPADLHGSASFGETDDLKKAGLI